MSQDLLINSRLINDLEKSHLNRRLISYSLIIREFSSLGIDGELKRIAAEAYQASKKIPSGALLAAFSDPAFGYWLYISNCLINRIKNNEKIPLSDVPHLKLISSEEILYAHLTDLNRWLLTGALLSKINIKLLVRSYGDEIYLPILGLRIKTDKAYSFVSYYYASQHNFFINGNLLKDFNHNYHSCFSHILNVMSVHKFSNSHGRIILDCSDPYIVNEWSSTYKYPDGKKYIILDQSELNQVYPNVSNALMLIDQIWPKLHSNIFSLIKVIHIVGNPYEGKHVSCSNQYFSGAFLLSNEDEYILAEAIIHEYFHNVLNLLISQGDIFDGKIPKSETFYSPWRQDARSISGVLHAVVVFTYVAEFMQKVLIKNNMPDIQYRLKEILIRLKLGNEVLIRYNFTKIFILNLLIEISNKIDKMYSFYPEKDFLDIINNQQNHLKNWTDTYIDFSDDNKYLHLYICGLYN